MRYWSRSFILLLILLLFCTRVSAVDLYESQSAMERALPSESRKLLSGIAVDDRGALSEKMIRIMDNAAQEIRTSWFIGIKTIARVMVAALLCGAARGLRHAAANEKALPIISMAGTLTIASIVLFDVNGMMMICRETMESISVFSKTMIPVMAAAVSVSGAPARAAAMQAAIMLALNLMIRMITEVLMPAVCMYLAVMTVNYALGQNILRKTGEFILWIIKLILKTSMTIFVTYLTISGAFGGSADSVAVKTAKAALSGMVPVVGRSRCDSNSDRRVWCFLHHCDLLDPVCSDGCELFAFQRRYSGVSYLLRK